MDQNSRECYERVVLIIKPLLTDMSNSANEAEVAAQTRGARNTKPQKDVQCCECKTPSSPALVDRGIRTHGFEPSSSQTNDIKSDTCGSLHYLDTLSQVLDKVVISDHDAGGLISQ